MQIHCTKMQLLCRSSLKHLPKDIDSWMLVSDLGLRQIGIFSLPLAGMNVTQVLLSFAIYRNINMKLLMYLIVINSYL